MGWSVNLSVTEHPTRNVTISGSDVDHALPPHARTSPLFAVDKLTPVLPSTASYYILFLFSPSPFTLLGELSVHLGNKTDKNGRQQVSQLWFSHGLANIVLITEDDLFVDHLVNFTFNKVSAWERWQVADGVIDAISDSQPRLTTIPPRLLDYSILDLELKNDLEELSACIDVAYCRCSIYAPNYIRIFDSVHTTVNTLIATLLQIEDKRTDFAGREQTLETEVALFKLQHAYNRIRSEVVQLNAAMAYSISQWFSGTIPILEHECQIRQEALLGIGTGYQGVAAILFRVEHNFADEGIDSRLSQTVLARPGTGFDIGQNTPGQTPDWSRLGINSLGPRIPGTGRHLLVNFSARRGFRESPHCITVPLEVLYHGGTAAWSLMTFSHEIVHAHVRGLLATIFASDHSIDDQSQLAMSRSSFASICELYRHRLATTELSFRECLQLCILHYITLYASKSERVLTANSNGAQGNPPQDASSSWTPVKIRGLEAMRQDFIDRHHLINEIIVHVLDLLYFYDADVDLYVRLLWTSWCRVPTVLDHVRDYIIRTLSAISCVVQSGQQSNTQRFDVAVDRIKGTLADLCKSDPHPVFTAASKLLQDQEELKIIRRLFHANVYLVDYARLLLHSESLHAALFDDPRRDTSEVAGYEIDIGTFSTDGITSPIAFIQEMLRRSLLERWQPNEIEHTTSWMLLVAASVEVSH